MGLHWEGGGLSLGGFLQPGGVIFSQFCGSLFVAI